MITDYLISNILRKVKFQTSLLSKVSNDFKNIYSSSLRKELFIKVALPLIVKENENLILQNLKVEKLKNQFNSINKV